MKKVLILSAMFFALIGCEQQSAQAPAEQPAAAAPAQEGQAPAEGAAPAAPAGEQK